ncbi:unnamed protein product [Coffea canephora]|uniref:laccase n=1 Tax=Coffea canephora TaxID=49390 RepID=A0A068TY21_COFCA|nr:unnamed protein product [Coffea canephora]CDP20836.1 unnamed protein product [Coffea canephora]
MQIEETPYTRLCSTKNILTVNGQFPGPSVHIRQGDSAIVHVHNKGNQNITIHWYAAEFFFFALLQENSSKASRVTDEIGTLWWHAHSDWSTTKVHGAFIVYPKRGENYPFPQPHAEFPIILAEWWKSDVQTVLSEFLSNGGGPNVSDAFLINGQPGDLYPCSKPDTFKLAVEYGKTYLLRMINTAMNNILFFSIAKLQVTVVGSGGSYTKPFKSDYIAIPPGQTIDFLLEANQVPDHCYMAARVYNSASLASKVDVPLDVDTKLFLTISVNLRLCEANNTCAGPAGLRFAATVSYILYILKCNVSHIQDLKQFSIHFAYL